MIRRTENIHAGIEKLASSRLKKIGVGALGIGAGLYFGTRNFNPKKRTKKSKTKNSLLLHGGPASYSKNRDQFAHFNLPDGNTIAVHESITKGFYKAGPDLAGQLNYLKPYVGTKVHMFSPKNLTPITPKVKRSWKNRHKNKG